MYVDPMHITGIEIEDMNVLQLKKLKDNGFTDEYNKPLSKKNLTVSGQIRIEYFKHIFNLMLELAPDTTKIVISQIQDKYIKINTPDGKVTAYIATDISPYAT